MPNAQCSKPDILCPMLYALRPKPDALRCIPCPMPSLRERGCNKPMAYAQCPIRYALRPMPRALCPVPSALNLIPIALCPMLRPKPDALHPTPCPTLSLRPTPSSYALPMQYKVCRMTLGL